MTIPTKLIPDFVSDMIATWGGEVGVVPTFGDGDVLLATFQAVSTQLDFLQAQIQRVLELSRSQTSTGDDLDSWMAQFAFARLTATSAGGIVVLSRASAAPNQISVPLGTIVQTSGGTVQFQLVADTGRPNYDATAHAYILPAGSTAMTVTVAAITGGAASNVAAQTISQLGSSAPGIEFVTNLNAFTNGFDAESDAAFRGRFILYLATLAKATKAALRAAALSVQQGLLVNLLENQRPDGSVLIGSFTAIIDDGTGSPPTSLLNSVYTALDLTRAFSVQPFVTAPTVIGVTISIAVHLATGTSQAVTTAAVAAAIALMVNRLSSGDPLYVSAINTAALSIPGVVAVSPSTTINGAAADLLPAISQEARTTVGGITVSLY